MAASAAHGDAQDRPPERVELVVDDVHLQLQLVLVHQRPRPDRQEAGRHDLLSALGIAVEFQDVARHLFANETVVGLVAVERVDHVVAVAPGIGRRNSAAKPQRVGITCQVEPVPTPSLPESGRRQVAIHGGFKEPRPRLCAERLQLANVCWRGGKARKVQRQSPQQGVPVRCADRCQPTRLQLGQHEPVDVPCRPFRAAHRRRTSRSQRLPSPMRGSRLRTLRGRCQLVSLPLRPRCAQAHPFGQVIDLGVRQLSSRRHCDQARFVAHRQHQAAGFRLAWNHDGAGPAAPLDGRRTVEAEFAKHGGSPGAMALVAVLRQQRPDLLLKVIQAWTRRVGRLSSCGQTQQRCNKKPCHAPFAIPCRY